MKKSHYTESQIVKILKGVEAVRKLSDASHPLVGSLALLIINPFGRYRWVMPRYSIERKETGIYKN